MKTVEQLIKALEHLRQLKESNALFYHVMLAEQDVWNFTIRAHVRIMSYAVRSWGNTIGHQNYRH